MIETYADPCTINSRKVLAGFDLAGVPFHNNFINYFKAEQKSEAYLKINPMATVPAAVHDGCTITESNAILQYGADLVGSSAYPKDLKQRANINRWLLWEASVWFGTCYIYLIQNVVQPLLGGQPDQAAIDAEAPNFHRLAKVLEAGLEGKKFLNGDEPTIADIAVAAPMHLHRDAKLPLENYPNISRWIVEVEKLPSWQKTQPAVEKALLPNKAATTSATNGNHVAESTKGHFNYTKDVEGLTELYFYETPKAANIHEPGDDPREMPVYDGWHRAKEFSFDKEGFSVEDFKPAYDGSWEDEENVRSKFYPEVVAFIKKLTGASRVLVFDHTIRTRKNATKALTQETNTSQRAPVKLVHCDYTDAGAPVRVRQLLPNDADDLLTRRVAFLNVWKPLNVVEENPLAMCDVNSSPNDDFFKLYLRYRDRDGENYVMRHNPEHKWWYFPKMTPEQAIILKTYDSETDGRARFVGHSAFDDPKSAKDAPYRESVEIRTIAFF